VDFVSFRDGGAWSDDFYDDNGVRKQLCKKKFAVLFEKKISNLMPCNFCLLKSNDKRREEKVKRVFCLK